MNNEGGKGGVRITNHGNKMFNFTFHVKKFGVFTSHEEMNDYYGIPIKRIL